MKVQSLITIKENRKQVQMYLNSIGGDMMGPVDGEKAFEKIRVVRTVGILVEDIDPSSEDEYFLDDD